MQFLHLLHEQLFSQKYGQCNAIKNEMIIFASTNPVLFLGFSRDFLILILIAYVALINLIK